MANATLKMTDGDFAEKVLSSEQPVLVDFWATWCGPCRVVAPVVDELATELAGRAKVGKLDIDDNHQTALRYGVRSIPTLLVFKNGQEVERVVGAVPKAQLLALVSRHL